MDRAAHYRDKANRALRLAEAAWQPELKDRLRSLAKDYDEIAEDIETGATEIRHPRASRQVITPVHYDLRPAHPLYGRCLR
jgi:hypothetical protein